MRILLIGFTKMKYMPYMNFYLEQLTKIENEVHLLYWNRDEEEDIPLAYDIKLHEFKLYQEDEVAKIKKVKSFIKYRKYTKELLIHEEFDFIIVMHTIPGVLLYDILKRYYSNNFILDYRDVTFEKIGVYKSVIHKLVEQSAATFVSSDAFRKYLPKIDKIYTSHNLLLDSLNNRDIRRNNLRKVEPIRIRYWGFIRHERTNRAIIDRLANDIRFELHYHGREQETAHNLKQHCYVNNIENVFFHGEYEPQERYEFAKETDLIHNIYENDSQTINAMGNKFYDGVVLYIPQLCSLGSYMGEIAKKSGVGIECNTSSTTFADDIYNYYREIDWDKFNDNCDLETERILYEYKKGIGLIKKILFNYGGIVK